MPDPPLRGGTNWANATAQGKDALERSDVYIVELTNLLRNAIPDSEKAKEAQYFINLIQGAEREALSAFHEIEIIGIQAKQERKADNGETQGKKE